MHALQKILEEFTSLKFMALSICEIIFALSIRIIKMWLWSPDVLWDEKLGMVKMDTIGLCYATSITILQKVPKQSFWNKQWIKILVKNKIFTQDINQLQIMHKWKAT